MNRTETMTVRTTRGELQYFRDWECEGSINMINPVTVKRYREIKEIQPDADKCGVFFAFNRKQFGEGYQKLVSLGHIKDGDKIYSMGGEGYGTEEGIDKFFGFYEERDKAIPKECDPQEIYFYEYNNHESMIAWDGDLEAIKIIIAIWGADVARKIIRYNASESIDNLIRKPIEVSGLYFMDDGEKVQPNNVWFCGGEDISALGGCHTMYGGVLYPVYDGKGNQYVMPELAGVSAHYDGEKLSKFHRG